MARRPVRGLTRAARVAAALAIITGTACGAVAGCSTGGDAGTPGTTAAPPGSGSGQEAGAGAEAGTGTGTGTDAGTPPPTTREPPLGAGTAAPGTPDAAALAVARAWFSWDTRLDGRPNDTVRRLALPLLAPDLRRQVTAFTGDAAPGDDWTRWTARHARATVVAAPGGDDRPDDATGTAWRQVLVRVVLHGDGGWEQVLDRAVFVRLDRVGGAWLAADVRSTTSG